MVQLYKPDKDQYILYNQDIISQPEEFKFPSVKRPCDSGEQIQRGMAIFFEFNRVPLVLKHYFRGGMMAKLSRDYYFWTGLKKTRVYKEWQLLETMNILKLPVPVPVVAKIKRAGLVYQSDLITQRISNAVPLGEKLKQDSIKASVWISLGKLIQVFHRHGIYHADLNANNILITDTNELYLIDFDKSCLRMKEKYWMNKMLARLERSFYKFKNNNNKYQFTSCDWESFMNGYSS